MGKNSSIPEKREYPLLKEKFRQGQKMLHNEKKGTILYFGGFELPEKNVVTHRVLNNAKLFREFGFKTVFLGVEKSITEER